MMLDEWTVADDIRLLVRYFHVLEWSLHRPCLSKRQTTIRHNHRKTLEQTLNTIVRGVLAH